MSIADVINPNFGKDSPLLRSNSDKQVLEKLNKYYSEAKQARMSFEKQWYVNLAFYFGKQWVSWTPGSTDSTTRLYTPPAPAWRVRLVSNKIKPIIRKEMAKITKEKPTSFIVPASTDDSDVMAARAGEHLIEHLWDASLKMNRVMRRATFWKVLCGTSFIKDWYDPKALDFDGKAGSIKSEPVSPFHLFVCDVQEEELENQPYVIHALAKTTEWVEEKYGKKVQPDATSSSGVLEQKFLNALGVKNAPKEDKVLVKECWIKPCKDYPQGAVIAWAGETLLTDMSKPEKYAWPYAHKEYPFTKLEHIPTGRFYADSVIPDLIPLQKEYNRTRSQIIESKNRMSKPQLLAARGSMDPKKVTSEPGLVIQYTPGFPKPEPLQLQSLPSYVLQELDRNQTDMNDISSQHEITKGQTPPGVEAATAIAYLQEQDDTVLAYSIASQEEAVERIGRHFLSHVQQYWNEPRKLMVIGRNNQLEAIEFSSAILKGNVDLRVQAGSGTPRSQAAKQAFIMGLGEKGWITPEQALKYLEMAEASRMYEDSQIDTRQAQRENLQMSQGTTVPPNTWDVHEIHIQEHNNYRKQQEYMQLPEEAQTLFEQHVQMHMLALQMQAQGMMPGMGMGSSGGQIQAGQPQLPGMGGGPQQGAPPEQGVM